MIINTILSLGFILLAGLASARLIRKLKIPSITSYLLLGILAGPAFLHLIPQDILKSSGLISNIVLSFIAFSLGQNFSLDLFKRIGRSVLCISIGEVLGAWTIVTLGIWLLLKQPFYVAILFGAIGSATAPAATMLVIREYKARGSFTDTLLGVVAMDDAWGIILFAISLAIAKSITSINGVIAVTTLPFVFTALLQIFGALVLGGLSGLCLSYFSRHLVSSFEQLTYVLGFVLLNTGLAIYFGYSVLLSNMFFGAVLVNANKESFKFFNAFRNFDSPFYILFFVLIGANLNVKLLPSLGLLGLVYISSQILGKITGATTGAYIAKADRRIKRYIGLGLIPQAGVALGLALIAKATFEGFGNIIFSTIVATTIIYELIGPSCTRYALKKAEEI